MLHFPRPARFCALALLAVTLLTGIVSTAAAEGPARPAAYPYKAVATTGMVADIVRQVAGDKAQVENLIGEGVDPHLYKATRSDMIRLQEAQIVFYSGLLLEGKMSDTLVQIARRKPVVAVTERIDESYLISPPELQGHHDPHVWMDPRGWSQCVEVVVTALSDFDPANADHYRTRGKAFREQLTRLDDYARQAVASIPEKSRVLVTAHDAFRYFGRAYDVEVLGIQGISTESEAALADINRLVELIVSRQIRAVFVETSVAEKNVRALIEGAKSRGHDLKIGGLLFSDAMGKPGTYEGTYIGMIDHNVTTIVRALGGKAPARGLNGKLAQEP